MNVQINMAKLAYELSRKRYVERLTLRELSSQLKLSPSTLSRIEATKMPDLLSYIIICRYLNRPFNHFFTINQP